MTPGSDTRASDHSDSTALVWFRRDLRNDDHAALYHALKAHERVFCVFVFDSTILDELPRRDRRVDFIHASVVELDRALRKQGGGVLVRHGDPLTEIPALAEALGAEAVYANHDYEPAAIRRDEAVAGRLKDMGRSLRSFKDQVIFERDEVLTQAGKPFSVFTPYKNAWLRKLAGSEFFIRPYPVAAHAAALAPPPGAERLPSLAELGFEPSNLGELKIPTGMSGGLALWDEFVHRMDDYKRTRDFPAVKGVSYLSVHLRFGTLSIRKLAGHAWRVGGEGAETWLSELVWRDFYQQILWHHPQVVDHAFKPEYDAIPWETGRDADALFAAWCEARTGYPIVDAAMRQINQTGYMHNRLRMIVASFLTKDLGIHWLRGERYFALHLNDYDLAANNGGWQWAASTGCDAQPYFRIFNPFSQSEKFDPQGRFIRRYLPELARVPDRYLHAPWQMPASEQSACGCVIGRDYPAPLVDHAVARELTLARFKRS
ncbi:cryptochrome/photolyase family protein [Uliginosibacterium sp. H1]|uniref:cryptochrome/photolyase family protein n=1 Tax=Uliginosibacterium sp. H1 TaxID=3114757 RepID=UPI002E16C47D|nr:deoxyribodipyrimidine photo-lyase [Uliginosibacterium sp. H1]